MKNYGNIKTMIATAFAVAFVVYSCKSGLSEAGKLDLSATPLQIVDSMNMVQTNKGKIEMRVVTGQMQRFDNDSVSREYFPEGMWVYAYTDDEVLESTIVSDEASHEKRKDSGEEIWMAFGNVVVKNIVKQQTMETDTIYWDRTKKEIYTDCYVRMYSPDGFMQGYGMRSDERARNSIIMKPFNNFAVVVKDTTEVLIDSANFIGPLLKK
ncbi:lipoprotein putative [Bacteroides sp. CAG:709]|nr:lipoprotein putative [Bacteroides sp. CAG:709]